MLTEITCKTMMNKLLIVVALLSLVGCNIDRAVEVRYTLPDELKDCKIFYLESARYTNLTVMRCPNSTTSTNYAVRVGKTTKHVTNIVEDSP